MLFFLDGFTGVYGVLLSPKCWSADSQRVILACPQRSRRVEYITASRFILETKKYELTCLVKYGLVMISCTVIVLFLFKGSADGGHEHRNSLVSYFKLVSVPCLEKFSKKIRQKIIELSESHHDDQH